MKLKPGQSPPIVPWALHISEPRNAYRLPTVTRLQLRYQTPTTIRGRVVAHIGPAPRFAGNEVSEHQHQAYCCPDDNAWEHVQATYTAYQEALDALAAALRELGSYSSRLSAAGGPKKASNPLSPTVIHILDPDGVARWWYEPMKVPRIERIAIERHTPQMLREAGAEYTGTSQTDHFVCPADDDWARVEALHTAATKREQAWHNLLAELGTYAAALADGRYASLRTAPLLDAPTPTASKARPTLVETFDPAQTDLDDALLEQLRGGGYVWKSAKRTPDGRWHHLIKPYGGEQRLLRVERLAELLTPATEQALAVIESPIGDSAIVGVVMMDAEEARATIAEIKGHLESARVKLLDLEEREGWRALGYESWRACAAAEFGQSQAYLYRQLSAAKIERDLDSPIGEISESHLRPLSKLDTTEERRDAWQRANEIAGDAPRTAKHVEQAVAEQRPPAPALADAPAGWAWQPLSRGYMLRRIADGTCTRGWASATGAIEEAAELDRTRRSDAPAPPAPEPEPVDLVALFSEARDLVEAGADLAAVLDLADRVPRAERRIVEEALGALHPVERQAALAYDAAHPSRLATWDPTPTNLGVIFARAWQLLERADIAAARQQAQRLAGADVQALARRCIDAYEELRPWASEAAQERARGAGAEPAAGPALPEGMAEAFAAYGWTLARSHTMPMGDIAYVFATPQGERAINGLQLAAQLEHLIWLATAGADPVAALAQQWDDDETELPAEDEEDEDIVAPKIPPIALGPADAEEAEALRRVAAAAVLYVEQAKVGQWAVAPAALHALIVETLVAAGLVELVEPEQEAAV
jgi:hypothetical protein